MAKQVEEERVFFYIPCDFVQEILSRLDVKSLMRCQCVCKAWLSLIRNPDFINLHLKRQPPYLLVHKIARSGNEGFEHMLSVHSSENFDEISSHRLPMNHRPLMMLTGNDNGILCFYDLKDDMVCLWNPTIREFKTLPPCPPTPPQWERTHSRLGLGYDMLTTDFKVVMVTTRDDTGYRNLNLFRRDNQVGVYSLASNAWKTKKMPNLFSEFESGYDLTTYIDYRCSSVVINGSIHWMVCFGRSADYHNSSLGIVVFDLSTEIFKLAKSPPTVKGSNVKRLGKLSECLAFFTFDEFGSQLVEVWVMKKYGVWDSWFKYLSLDLFSLRPNSIGSYPGYFPVGFLSNGNMVFSWPESGYWCSYDPKSNNLKILCPRLGVSEFTTFVTSIFKLRG